MNGSRANPTLLYEYSWKYDQNSNVTAVVENVNGKTTTYAYSYNVEQQPTGTTYGPANKKTEKTITYDAYGSKIHKEYKRHLKGQGKEHVVGKYRIDCVDDDTIYELKPFNPKAARAGVRQLEKYNNALGGGFKMRLEFY